MSLTRRTLLRRGGATAAGAGVLGSLTRAAPAEAKLGDDRARGVLIVVLPLVRSSHVGAFKDGGHANTPNLNDLTGRSLRANRAIPESMPAVSARRALVTGMRAFPFRDWRRLEGFPSVPGFNPVWDHQPLLMERTREAGVQTIYVTDNPLFQGPRFEGVRAPGGTAVAASPGDTIPDGLDQELLGSFARLTEATKRTFREGVRALGEVKDAKSFLVGVDPFDPIDAYAAPPFYVRPGRVEDDGLGPTDGRMVPLQFSDKDVDRVREAYVAHVEAVDDELGELIDAVPDDTAVFVLGDHGVALGEHGYLGRAAPTSHRLSYEVPYLIKHPSGQNGGDHIAWYASTHDVAPTALSFLGLPIPGKMDGEDLTALFDDVDQWDLPKREKVITAVGSQIIIRDNRWLVVADRERTIRRMYDDDEEVDDDPPIKRYDNIAGKDTGKLNELSLYAGTVAGGTVPEFGPDGAVRPKREDGDDDVDNDGIPNDFDAFDNEHPQDGVTKEDLQFDGRYVEGGPLRPVTIPKAGRK
jgi:arylsulfatase A-like enzyme